MEQKMDMWALNNSTLEKGYSLKNLKMAGGNVKNGKCILFFSGNGLYKKDDIETFQEVIFENDRYEWQHVAASKQIINEYERIIFVRDVYKMWYVKGINSECDSVEKLLNELRNLTNGFHCVTVGNSAGGYAAVLFGKLLNADAILSFCGQFDLDYTLARKPILLHYKEDGLRSQYYDLTTKVMEVSNSPIFYFFPSDVDLDRQQYKLVEDRKDIYPFIIKGSVHGETVKGYLYPDLLTVKSDLLKQISDNNRQKIYDKEELAIMIFGRTKVWYRRVRSRSIKGNIYELLRIFH